MSAINSLDSSRASFNEYIEKIQKGRAPEELDNCLAKLWNGYRSALEKAPGTYKALLKKANVDGFSAQTSFNKFDQLQYSRTKVDSDGKPLKEPRVKTERRFREDLVDFSQNLVKVIEALGGKMTWNVDENRFDFSPLPKQTNQIATPDKEKLLKGTYWFNYHAYQGLASSELFTQEAKDREFAGQRTTFRLLQKGRVEMAFYGTDAQPKRILVGRLNRKQPLVVTSESGAWEQCIFQWPNEVDLADWVELTGLHTQTTPDGKITSRTIVLNRPEPGDAPSEAISPELAISLYKGQLNLPLPTKGTDESERLKKRTGMYRGQWVQYADDAYWLETIALEILPDGRAILGAENENEVKRRYWGRVRSVREKGGLIAYFDRMDGTVHRLTIYIDTHNNVTEEGVWGVYSGMKNVSYRPIAARVVFHKEASLQEYTLLDSTTQKSQLDTLVMRRRISLEEATGNDILYKLIFGGHSRDFIQPVSSVSEPLINDPDVKPLRERISDFAGLYYVYVLSTKQSFIGRLPLVINEAGRVEMTHRDGTVTLFGWATIAGNFLSIFLDQSADRADAVPCHILIHVDAGRPNSEAYKLKTAYGTSSLANHDEQAIGRIVVLETVRAGAIERIPENYSYRAFFLESVDFLEEDEHLDGLLTYMSGKIGRYVIAPKRDILFKPTGHSNLRKDRDVLLLFNSACYLANTAQPGQVARLDEATRQFYQAYLTGFVNVKLLDAEVKPDGHLYPLLNHKNAVHPTDTPGESAKLGAKTFNQLVEMIRKRAKQLKLIHNRAAKSGTVKEPTSMAKPNKKRK